MASTARSPPVVRWLALTMVLVQFAIVVGRYVFGVNSIAAQESVLYMHATLFMLGAGYTLLVDKHVRVDIFYAKASDAPRAAHRHLRPPGLPDPVHAGAALLVLAVGAQFLGDPGRPDLGRRHRGGVPDEDPDPGLLRAAAAAVAVAADPAAAAAVALALPQMSRSTC
jgi:hypothetical protein